VGGHGYGFFVAKREAGLVQCGKESTDQALLESEARPQPR